MDYIVLKRTGETGEASDWDPVTIVRDLNDGEAEAAVKQAFAGDGRYKALPWPAAEGSEFDLGAQPMATPVTTPPAE